MKSKILVDYESYMCSVALLEDGVLKEFYVEDRDTERITGDIYKGKVVNVCPGLDSAFVDIGKKKNGFLAASDMLENRTALERSGKLPTRLNVTEGEFILVQAVKEPTETKGARLSANLSIPGRYVVYMPTVDFIGVSNKITDEATRKKLYDILESNRPSPECGFIARTAAKDAKKFEIIEEIKYFVNMYARLLDKFNETDGVARLSTDGDLVFRTVRDIFNSSVDEIVCNSAEIAHRLSQDLNRNLASAVKVTVCDNEDVLKKFGILGEVEKLLKTKVELPSGGNIVIDYTEALTVIDVNSAKHLGDNDRENTVFDTNCEAAKEIARQLRLRNIGGMIVIDFIDMQDPLHNEEVVEVLRDHTSVDRTRTRVLPMTELGLVQMTRKKVGTEIQSVLLNKCSACHGTAHTQTPNFMLRKIKAHLFEIFKDENCKAAIVTVNPEMYDMLEKGGWQFSYDKFGRKPVYVTASVDVAPNVFKISAKSDVVLSLPSKAYLLN
ncbi:MAG: Rne/Rng family ribonuclease [Clostridiales bacterium]|nr:Rne/Rng family ribonuclease [Clostridiales bacterium]